MREPAVYIMASPRDGTLYTGVASDLSRRAHKHREGRVEGFARRYGCKSSSGSSAMIGSPTPSRGRGAHGVGAAAGSQASTTMGLEEALRLLAAEATAPDRVRAAVEGDVRTAAE